MHYLGQYRRRGICLFTSSHWSLFVFAVWLTNPLGGMCPHCPRVGLETVHLARIAMENILETFQR